MDAANFTRIENAKVVCINCVSRLVFGENNIVAYYSVVVKSFIQLIKVC